MPPLPEPERRARPGFWLYLSHLLTAGTIAVSNVLLGLTLLSSPWTARRPVAWSRFLPLLVPLGLYVLFLAVATLVSPEPRVSAGALSELFSLTTLVLALALVRGERQVRRTVDGLVIVAALLAASGIAQFFFGYGGIDQRIRGPFSHYMTFAGFLLIADFLLLGALVCGKARSPWRWVALLVINVALLASLTRSAWVALALALVLLLALRAPRLLVLCPLAAVFFLVFAPVPWVQRATSIFNLRDLSNYDRLCMLEAGLTMIAERPFSGIGPDLVEERYPLYRPATAPRYQVPHLHNSFVELAAARGLPALASYLALMVVAAVFAYRGYRRTRHEPASPADLYLGALVAIVAFNLAGLFENNWGDTEVQRAILFVLAVPFCLREAGEGSHQDGETASAPL